MTPIARDLGGGALGGAAGTALFTGFMRAAQHAGLLGEMPPRTITRRVVSRIAGRKQRGAKLDVLTALGHLGYGIGSGAIFSLLHRPVRRAPTLAGALFGAAVFGASYAGWLPAFDILPPPHRDRPGRQIVTFLGHLIFGGVLGAVVGRARR